MNIPDNLINEFTMNNRIPVVEWLCNSMNEINWSDEIIDSYIKRFTPHNIIQNKNLQESYTGASESLLYMFKKYNIIGKEVAVIGSELPWIEAILINLGNNVTTIEYNIKKCKFKKLKCENYFLDFKKTNKLYDNIISFSSIEHSGLGRYGESLNPNGDFETMDDIYKSLKDDGLLIWGGPVGHDALVWNAHRVYGRIRLPYLFKKFEEIEWYGNQKEELLNLKISKSMKEIVIHLHTKYIEDIKSDKVSPYIEFDDYLVNNKEWLEECRNIQPVIALKKKL